jgi:hypothetical protein
MSNDRVIAALKPAVLDDPPADMDTRIAAIVGTPRVPGAARTRRPSRRPLVLVTAGAVVAAVAVTVVATGRGGHDRRVGPPEPVRIKVAALSFAQKGGYLTVRVKDPVADPARYKKEFAAHGLDVDLTLAPVSPKKAGTVVFLEDDGDGRVKTISAPGRCGTVTCGVGVRIPLGYKAHVKVVFGQAARPGQHYDTGPGDTPGEGVGLSDVRGRTVADVLAEARRRHIGDIEYRYQNNGTDRPYPMGVPADKVRSDWYVHDAAAGSTGSVILFVGPSPRG